MVYTFYLLVFVFGLGFGSFLNVLALRYDPNRSVFATESLSGRSYCPHCHKTLGPIELIPILSFFIQRGRCRACHHRLSFQYPLVEILSGLVFVFVPLFLNSFYGVSNTVFANFDAPRWYYGLVLLWVAAFWVWLLIATIDFRKYLIPDELNLILLGLAFLITLTLAFGHGATLSFQNSFLRYYLLIFSPTQNVVLNHLLGGVFGFLFFNLLIVVSRARAIGFGDAKLALVSGFLIGWPDMGLAVSLAFVIGGFVGVFLLLRHKKTFHSKVPFAPFLVSGLALVFFCGYGIVHGYFALFHL